MISPSRRRAGSPQPRRNDVHETTEGGHTKVMAFGHLRSMRSAMRTIQSRPPARRFCSLGAKKRTCRQSASECPECRAGSAASCPRSPLCVSREALSKGVQSKFLFISIGEPYAERLDARLILFLFLDGGIHEARGHGLLHVRARLLSSDRRLRPHFPLGRRDAPHGRDAPRSLAFEAKSPRDARASSSGSTRSDGCPSARP